MSTSAREAALRIILEDVEPLVVRAEEAGLLLARVEGELDADLKTLGETVQRVAGSLVELQALTKTVEAAVKNAGALAGAQSQRRVAPPSKASPTWLACLASGLIAALIVGGGLYLLGRDLVDQARVGRSLQQAWPSLDEATRQRVEQVLNRKSGR